MEFFKITKRFKDDEDGAVTVDWVVLTAAIVGLGIAVIASVRTARPSPWVTGSRPEIDPSSFGKLTDVTWMLRSSAHPAGTSAKVAQSQIGPHPDGNGILQADQALSRTTKTAQSPLTGLCSPRP